MGRLLGAFPLCPEQPGSPSPAGLQAEVHSRGLQGSRGSERGGTTLKRGDCVNVDTWPVPSLSPHQADSTPVDSRADVSQEAEDTNYLHLGISQ